MHLADMTAVERVIQDRDVDHSSTYRLYLMPPYEDEKACLPYEPDILRGVVECNWQTCTRLMKHASG